MPWEILPKWIARSVCTPRLSGNQEEAVIRSIDPVGSSLAEHQATATKVGGTSAASIMLLKEGRRWESQKYFKILLTVDALLQNSCKRVTDCMPSEDFSMHFIVSIKCLTPRSSGVSNAINKKIFKKHKMEEHLIIQKIIIITYI